MASQELLSAADYRRLLAVLEAAGSARSLDAFGFNLSEALGREFGYRASLLLGGGPRAVLEAAGGLILGQAGRRLGSLIASPFGGRAREELLPHRFLLAWLRTGLSSQGYLLLNGEGVILGDLDRARVEALRPHLGSLLRSHLASPAEGAWEGLSGREREVAGLAAGGRSNREIAGELGVSEDTVKKHLWHCFGKLGVHSRTQLALSQFHFRGIDSGSGAD